MEERPRRRLQACPRGVLLGGVPFLGKRRLAQEQAVELFLVSLESQEAAKS